MMRFATVSCPNRNCNAVYDAAVEDGYHAECPNCHQVNRVPGKNMSPEITGICSRCDAYLDEHLYGRGEGLFCCPPKKGTTT